MFISKAAGRYAKAVFDLAREEGCLEEVRADIVYLEEITRKPGELDHFLGDYMIARDTRHGVLEKIFSTSLSALTWRFILFLEFKYRLMLLPDICRNFLDLHDEAAGILKAGMTSAFPVEERLVRAIADRIGARLGKTIEMTVMVDRDLLGGFKVRAGDVVYDASIAEQLRVLKKQMISG